VEICADDDTCNAALVRLNIEAEPSLVAGRGLITAGRADVTGTGGRYG